MRKYRSPTQQFFRLPNNIFQVPMDATQFKLYSYFVCCSGSKGYCWPNMETIMRDTGIKKSSLQKAIKVLKQRKLIHFWLQVTVDFWVVQAQQMVLVVGVAIGIAMLVHRNQFSLF